MTVGNYRSALEDISSAIEIDPTDPFAYMGRAVVHFNMGQSQDAVDDFGRHLSLGGDDPAEAYFLRGIALVTLGKFEEARADLETALGQDPFVAKRVIAKVSDLVGGSDSLILQDEVPADILEMLKPAE